jgi:putative ABC transport system permease protein
MKLAWHNLIHDRLRFLVTVIGIAFAVFLMVFQGSLLAGFLRAAGKGIDTTDSDIWITARGVDCFEFATPLPKRFRDIALGVRGVDSVKRMVVGYAAWKKPSGRSQLVLLIGAEPGVGERFPIPRYNQPGLVIIPEALLVDQSNVDTLEVTATPIDLEVNHARAKAVNVISEFSSFFGAPYVFTEYNDGVRYLGLNSEETFYLIVRVRDGYEVDNVKQALRSELPEADIWRRDEFSQRARTFWVMKTGAGGALLTAAFLGFLVGLVVVSQNIYATTMENLEEFATLKAIGASRRYIRRVVLAQALASGLVGSLVGLIAVYPATRAIRGTIAWIYTPWWLPALMIGMGLLMCAMASVLSIRKALAVEPAKVFRA